jgi:hypothetical protein
MTSHIRSVPRSTGVAAYPSTIILSKFSFFSLSFVTFVPEERLTPGFTWKLKLRINTSPLGEMIGTRSKMISSSDSTTWPRCWRTTTEPNRKRKLTNQISPSIIIIF